MKRVREIDLEAPVREDDDGDDEGNGGENCASTWDEKLFTKKGRWIHNRQPDVPQHDLKAGVWPRDSGSPRTIDVEKYQNLGVLEFQVLQPGINRFPGHDEAVSDLRMAPEDLLPSVNPDFFQGKPHVRREEEQFGTAHTLPAESQQQTSGGDDCQVMEGSAKGVDQQPVCEEHSVQPRSWTFPHPLAFLLYPVDDGQDAQLHSILEKQSSLFNQADLNTRLEAISFIGQHVELIKESRTRKLVTEIIQQQLWKAEEQSVVQALVAVLCSVANISCADDRDGNENLDWASYVARFLLQYITAKDVRSTPMKSGLKVQLLRSLSLIGQGGGSLELESVGPLAKEQLGSSNPRLREYGIRLLVQSIKERDPALSSGRGFTETRAGGHFEDVQRSRAEGDSLMHTLLEFTQDPYPNVREAVVGAILHLHSKGFALNQSTYKFAVALLRDSFEAVRICAVKLVGVWVKASPGDELQRPQSEYIDNAFLQICNMMTDMTMSVRQEACNVLAEMTGVSDSVLLQSLTKKILTTSATERGVAAGGSSSISSGGDLDVLNVGENKLFDWSAAGAFVIGLEDEYCEVRSGAVKALAKLGVSSEKMAKSSLELIIDMIHDGSSHVRLQTIRALTNLALAGRLSVLEAHLHMFTGILEDSNTEMRKAGHDLLSVISLPTMALFQSCIRAILTSLDKHPEDEESLLVTLEKLGKSHASHTESMASELVQEMRGLLGGDLGLDQPRCAAILVLLLGAARENRNIISLIPSRIIYLASLLGNKLPRTLPPLQALPVSFKTLLYAWSTTDAFTPSGSRSHDQSGDSRRQRRRVSDSQHVLENGSRESRGEAYISTWAAVKDGLSHERMITTPAESEGNQRSNWLSVMEQQYRENGVDQFAEQETLEAAQRMVSSALSTRPLLDVKAFEEALQRLRGCRRELRALKGRRASLSGMLSFCGLYLECLTLVVQLRAQFFSQESRSLVKASGAPQDLLNKLDSVLQHVIHRFSGFPFEQVMQILDLHAVVSVWKLALHPVDRLAVDGPSSLPSLELRCAVKIAETLVKNQDLSPSPLLRSVQEELLSVEGSSSILSMWRTARRLALSYWPSRVSIDASIKEMRAVVKAPGSDFDQPIGFIAGLPLGIPVDVTVYNTPSSRLLWIEFARDASPPGFKLLGDVEDSCTNSESGSTRRLSTLLQLEDMPAVASSMCRLRVVMEGDHHRRRDLEFRGAANGPRVGCVVPLCTETEVHLYRNRERGSKQPPHSKR